MQTLEFLRDRIDETDEKIIELLRERMSISAEIANFKLYHGMEVYVPEREKQLLERVSGLAGAELSSYISEIYDTVLSRSREYQLSRMQNLILIGMPGCGKTTVGSAVAQILGKKFYDTDAIIEEKTACTIPKIFASLGEASFRETEHSVIEELSAVRASVIATGGGAALREDNRLLLGKNSLVVWLKRELAELPVDGRPLSLTAPAEELYRQRAPIYEELADVVIDNDCESPELTAQKLVEVLKL